MLAKSYFEVPAKRYHIPSNPASCYIKTPKGCNDYRKK